MNEYFLDGKDRERREEINSRRSRKKGEEDVKEGRNNNGILMEGRMEKEAEVRRRRNKVEE